MFLYRTSNGLFVLNDRIVPSGKYTAILSENTLGLRTIETDSDLIDYPSQPFSFYQKEDGTPYVSGFEIMETFEGFFNKAYLDVRLQDYSGNTASTSIFGDSLIGVRKTSIASQFQYGIPTNAATSVLENGGTIGIEESMLKLQTGTDTAGKASISNKKSIRYIPGHEAFIYFTAVFSSPQENSYQRAGVFDDQNGFFIGFEGTQFTVTTRRLGIDTHINIDEAKIFSDGTFNPSLGNVYKISFGYLGFANITFHILTPTGGWKVIYSVNYPNSATNTHITNTNLPPTVEIANTGNNTNIAFKTGSFSAGIVDGGGQDPASRNFSFSRNSVNIVPEFMAFVTFRNKDTFFGITNYISSILRLLNPAADLSKNSVWEFRKNMTIVNSPTWNDVSVDSTTEYSEDVTVTQGTGQLLFSFVLGKSDRLFEDVSNYNLELFPGETISLLIYTPQGVSGTIDLSIRWKELF